VAISTIPGIRLQKHLNNYKQNYLSNIFRHKSQSIKALQRYVHKTHQFISRCWVCNKK